MADSAEHTYEMRVGLGVLKHLGIGLYSNVPAVLSEVVANSWDADATTVLVQIDRENGRITITDNGHGMTIEDVNRRYLNVGYERRNEPNGAVTAKFGRPVMGRKGIGKLSLFSIAQTVTIHTKRAGHQAHGFVMDSEEIKRQIGEDGMGQYNPVPVDPSEVHLDGTSGTRIVLTRLNRQIQRASEHLRRRLARRFSVIGELNDFDVTLDGSPITIEDRGYHNKVEYLWSFGERGQALADVADLNAPATIRPGEIAGDEGYEIDGWIGTALLPSDLKENGESLNKIIVMVRGKLAQEDILDEFSEGRLYTKYLIGEIHADFLDLDDLDDIATSSRQKIVEDDDRYRALRQKIRAELLAIRDQWDGLRDKEGQESALEILQIKQWFEGLTPEYRPAATRLFGRLNKLHVEDANDKRQLFISGILAFENLRYRSLLERIDEVAIEDLGAVGRVFGQLDDLEASAYYQISKDRLAVIDKLGEITDDDAKERVMQEHLFKHLWLLDPSWERATSTEVMESRMETAFEHVAESLTEEQRLARVDIKYSTTAGKHVIIELKRAGRVTSSPELLDQIFKYNGAARKVLEEMGRLNEPLEFICVVGRPLSDWGNPGGREQSDGVLAGANARVVMYDELINNAQQAYADYLEQRAGASAIYELVTGIDQADFDSLYPDSP